MGCLIYCTTILIISVCLFYAYAKYKLSYWSKRGVKTPPTHLIFGNFKECFILKKAPDEVLREIYNSADLDDPYIGFYIFHKPMLLMRNHDMIKQVMIKDFETFPNRRFGSYNEKDSIYMRSILAIKQPTWKYLKSKLTPSFTGQKLKKMVPLIVECKEHILNFIESLPTDKADLKKYESKQLSSRYVADVLASLFFGINTNSFNADENTFWKNGYDLFNSWKTAIPFIVFFYIPEWIYLVKSFTKKYGNYFREIFWDSVNTREKMGYTRNDMIDTILALKNGEQNPIYRFEGDQLAAQATSLFLAAFEATSSALAFVLHDLASNPAHQASVYDEIQTYMSGKEMDVDLINKMSFLDSVVVESLRLHPPLPITDRIAIRDYKLPGTGLIIEKGIGVYVSINATNQDPKYFLNPQNFIPLRKMEEGKKLKEILAFGIGPRSCIGQRLGLIIIKVAVITILLNFTLCHERNKNDISNDSHAIRAFTYTANSLYVHFKKRDKCV